MTEKSTERSDNDNKNHKQNVPELRFNEFNNDWKTVQGKDVYMILGGNAYKSKEASDSGVKWLKIANVGINKLKENPTSFLPIKYNKDRKYKLTKGDVVLALTRPILDRKLKIAIINDFFNNSLLNQRVAKITSNNSNLYFIYYYLQRQRIINDLENRIMGTDPPNLSIKDLQKIQIKIPSINEQEKISSFLSDIDKKIELMETKLKNNDEIINNIRNKIYTNISNPIKCELKDICNIIKGKQLNKEYMNNTAKYYVLNGGKFPSGYTDDWNVKENTITISEGGESCGYVNYNKEKFYCGGHCYYLELKDEINKYYFFNYLKFREQDIMRLRVGSGLPNIQKKDLLKLKIEIHDNNQEKIGTLLQLLVNKSLNLKKEIKYYQEFKKSLLNKMFC